MTIKGIWETKRVFIGNLELSPKYSQKLRNHSPEYSQHPDSFSWGCGGGGPAQLALALLLCFVKEGTALRLEDKFKWDIIAKLPASDFELDEKKVSKWIAETMAEIHDAV